MAIMRIRELRERAGLSQSELARRMGLTRPSVIQWELGQSLPTSDKLPLLAEVLACTVDELYKKSTA